MPRYQNGPKKKREDGEEEKEFRMLKSDDKCDVFDYGAVKVGKEREVSGASEHGCC